MRITKNNFWFRVYECIKNDIEDKFDSMEVCFIQVQQKLGRQHQLLCWSSTCTARQWCRRGLDFLSQGASKDDWFPTKRIHFISISPKVRCFGVSFLRFTVILIYMEWIFHDKSIWNNNLGLYHAPTKTFPIFQETHLYSIKCQTTGDMLQIPGESFWQTAPGGSGNACIPQKFNIRQLLKTWPCLKPESPFFKAHHFGYHFGC